VRFLPSLFLVVGFLVTACSTARADDPPTVTYSVGGSSNDWTLDFTVDNNTNQNLYFVGVQLPATDVTGAPSSDWCVSPACDTPWSNSAQGGSSISYNNVWIIGGVGSVGSIDPGDALSGFTALDTTDLASPTIVPWFAYTEMPGRS
jgi:hypothetical protein